MVKYISILRGINVSGQKKILMTDLKALYESIGFKDVKTYIQSGNVIFSSLKKSSDIEAAKKIEKAIQVKYGFEVPVVIRTSEEMANVISGNPFLRQKGVDVEKLHVTFLTETPTNEALKKLEEVNFTPDDFVVTGKEVYLHIPGSYGETKLSNKYFENKLKVTATTRNWKTVNKLYELAVSKE